MLTNDKTPSRTLVSGLDAIFQQIIQCTNAVAFRAYLPDYSDTAQRHLELYDIDLQVNKEDASLSYC